LFILDDPIFNGLAISLIFGISISTLLTLIVIRRSTSWRAWSSAARSQEAPRTLRRKARLNVASVS
jgi:hypothetical protein